MTILVISNDSNDLGFIKSTLHNNSTYFITYVSAVSDGVELLKKDSFDLIILSMVNESDKIVTDFVELCTELVNTELIILNSCEVEESLQLSLNNLRSCHFINIRSSGIQLRQIVQNNNHRLGAALGSSKIVSSFFVKVLDRYKLVQLEDVMYFEVKGTYINIVFNKGSVITRTSLSSIAKKTPDNFKKLHGSFLVNVSKIKEILIKDRILIMENNIRIPFSRKFKSDLIRAINIYA